MQIKFGESYIDMWFHIPKISMWTDRYISTDRYTKFITC